MRLDDVNKRGGANWTMLCNAVEKMNQAAADSIRAKHNIFASQPIEQSYPQNYVEPDTQTTDFSYIYTVHFSLSIHDHQPFHITCAHPLPLIHTLNTGHWQTGLLTETCSGCHGLLLLQNYQLLTILQCLPSLVSLCN
ncbi:PREDICTED: uncharacterized protein LOC109583370 [Amphimedon queenslandica]|uniref:Uncharacterized protein n=1 Tax=Amphimedon queenslandica TaxID=400682 RepID=A0AAN0JBU7_AMPQE|nr:PREDICTED: uncharacterized protein LOC109583370 [Amphimedon queenslandica]|eukprot:XP_019854242.1 PREDICTED: uncharacterized protein LOC109583370 [Amphimedon queenslandica]